MNPPSRIVQIATANPPLKTSQTEVWDSIRQNPSVSAQAKTYYKRFLLDPGIQTRYFGMRRLEEVQHESVDACIRRFQREAVSIGTAAARRCLQAAARQPQDIDALIVTTCTGYLCPGLTSYIAQATGLRDDVFTLDLVGLGCGAALPALQAGDQFLRAHPHATALVVCVEICSAAIHWGDEIELILSNAIFADGAAACLLSADTTEPGLALTSCQSILWPEYRDDLRFLHRNARLCNVLSRQVPDIVAEALDRLMARVEPSELPAYEHYAVHPGGRRILDRIEEHTGALRGRLGASRQVLRDYGNMSSPSVLYVVQTILDQNTLQEGERIFMMTFGAGFTAFGAQLTYCGGRVSSEVSNVIPRYSTAEALAQR